MYKNRELAHASQLREVHTHWCQGHMNGRLTNRSTKVLSIQINTRSVIQSQPLFTNKSVQIVVWPPMFERLLYFAVFSKYNAIYRAPMYSSFPPNKTFIIYIMLLLTNQHITSSILIQYGWFNNPNRLEQDVRVLIRLKVKIWAHDDFFPTPP